MSVANVIKKIPDLTLVDFDTPVRIYGIEANQTLNALIEYGLLAFNHVTLLYDARYYRGGTFKELINAYRSTDRLVDDV